MVILLEGHFVITRRQKQQIGCSEDLRNTCWISFKLLATQSHLPNVHSSEVDLSTGASTDAVIAAGGHMQHLLSKLVLKVDLASVFIDVFGYARE